MECRLKCEKPEEILYTVTITATAKEWELLREQLKENPLQYPSFTLIQQINDMLAQARKIYWPATQPTAN